MYAPLRLGAMIEEAEGVTPNTNNSLDVGRVFRGKPDKR